MALVKSILKTQLKQAFLDQRSKKDNPEAAIDDLCDKLTDAIDAYIKSATITVLPGIPVATTGTAAAQVGATTDPGETTIL